MVSSEPQRSRVNPTSAGDSTKTPDSDQPYERLSTQDSSFLLFERRETHMHVGAVSTFEAGSLATPEGRLDIERICAHIESRLHLFPRYRQRLGFTPIQRQPIWIDDERFNLRYHVRHTSLPQPGTAEQLKDLVGRIMSQQLDRKKPLWEMWFVEGLVDQRVALISKMHHCLVDGASGVSLMTALLSTSLDRSVEPAPHWIPRPAPTPLELVRDEAVRRSRAPFSALSALHNALKTPRRLAASVSEDASAVWQTLNEGLRIVPSTPLNRPIGPHRRIDWYTLDLGEVKDLKKRLNGTVNDVVLTIVAGAVRRFLEHRHTRLDDLDYRVVIPVNMRSKSGDAGLANKVSAWFLSLPIDEPDPLNRFSTIQKATQQFKESKVARGTDLLTRLTDWTGSTSLTLAGVRLVSRLHPYNLIVTNVAGPQFPIYLLGARMLEMYPHMPLFVNQGLGVAIFSYLDKVCWGLIADWDLVPDLHKFIEALDASFVELRDAAETR